MSVQALNWAFEYAAENASEKAILLALANYAGGDGRCYPGQESIARKAACSERTVRSVLKSLEDRGVIARESRRRKDGSRTSDIIVLCSIIQPAEFAGRDKPNRQILSDQPAEFAGLTTFEPPEEPSEGSLSETTVPDEAEKPKIKKRISYPDLFESTWKAYPTDKLMSKAEAFAVWKKLDDEDRAKMAGAAPEFAAYCKSHPDYRPIHMCRFITKRRFDSFAPQPTLAAELSSQDWERRLGYGRRENRWFSAAWGPPPGKTGCLVPNHLIQTGDGEGWREADERTAA